MSKKKLILLAFAITIPFGIYFFSQTLNSPKLDNKIEQISNQVDQLKETIIPLSTKIMESGLPNKHFIQTVFVPQSPEKNWDQPWQDACEEASLLTVDYYYRQITSSNPQTIKDDLLKMIEFENQQSFSHDINLDQMAIVAQKYLGYSTEIIENPSIEDIKKYLAQDIPVIVTANGKTLYKENKHFKDGGPYYHSLVILGYDDNKQKFTVHDVGTQFGANFKYSYSLLLESIHDFPTSNQKQDINSGDKKVLILIK